MAGLWMMDGDSSREVCLWSGVMEWARRDVTNHLARVYMGALLLKLTYMLIKFVRMMCVHVSQYTTATHRESSELLDHVLSRDGGDGTRRRLPERVAGEEAQEVGVLAPVGVLSVGCFVAGVSQKESDGQHFDGCVGKPFRT